jgi:hypothetical protein
VPTGMSLPVAILPLGTGHGPAGLVKPNTRSVINAVINGAVDDGAARMVDVFDAQEGFNPGWHVHRQFVARPNRDRAAGGQLSCGHSRVLLQPIEIVNALPAQRDQWPMNKIFVFASDLAGRHGEGAALDAWRHHGAIRGKGEGPMGMAYAVPIRDGELRTLPLDMIQRHVRTFLGYAARNDNLTFQVTAVGTDAGYTDAEMALLFSDAPANCQLPEEWPLTSR